MGKGESKNCYGQPLIKTATWGDRQVQKKKNGRRGAIVMLVVNMVVGWRHCTFLCNPPAIQEALRITVRWFLCVGAEHGVTDQRPFFIFYSLFIYSPPNSQEPKLPSTGDITATYSLTAIDSLILCIILHHLKPLQYGCTSPCYVAVNLARLLLQCKIGIPALQAAATNADRC